MGKHLKYGAEILILLEAVWAPAQVAVMHCRAHQKPLSLVSQGNRRDDVAAKAAAAEPYAVGRSLRPVFQVPINNWSPWYTKEEEEWAEQQGSCHQSREGWILMPDKQIFIPETVAWPLFQKLHDETHFGKTALDESIMRWGYVNRLSTLTVLATCVLCAQNNPQQGPQLPP